MHSLRMLKLFKLQTVKGLTTAKQVVLIKHNLVVNPTLKANIEQFTQLGNKNLRIKNTAQNMMANQSSVLRPSQNALNFALNSLLLSLAFLNFQANPIADIIIRIRKILCKITVVKSLSFSFYSFPLDSQISS